MAITTMLLTAQLASRVDSSSTKMSGKSAAGFYAAEAGLNLRAKAIREKFVGYNVPTGTSPSNWTVCRNGGSGGSGDFACDNSLTVQDYLYPDDSTKRVPVSTYVIDQNQRDAFGVPQPTSVTINANEQFAGLNAQEYRYDVTSVAFDRSTSQPNAMLGIRFKSRLVPLFQFAAFYDKDLEILPSPTMTLSGPIHTNGDLYLVSDGSGSTLTLNGQVSVRNNLYRGRKNNTNCGAGTVRAFDGSSTTVMNCSGTRTQITDVSPWNNQVRINVPPVAVPPPEALDPSPSSAYWSKADLRVVLKLNSSNNPTGIEIRNADGSVDSGRTSRLLSSCSVANTTLANKSASVTSYAATDVTLNVASTSGLAVNDFYQVNNDPDSNVITGPDTNSDGLVDAGTSVTLRRQLGHTYQSGTIASAGNALRKAVVSTSDTFYNYREGKYIRMLNVDVGSLMNCIHQQNIQDSGRALDDVTEGGLVWFFTVDGPDSNRSVYATSNTPSDGNNYGVRLYNARTLQSSVSGAPQVRGLSVVSDQALYLTGDYNCGVWDGTSCPAKKPAAILADSINVVSNRWFLDDRGTTTYTSNLPDSAPNVGAQAAADTRVNAAFLAGTDTTGRQEGSAGQGDPYNGGLENYPRFHENWSGLTFRYRGSFVSLNRPRRVDGAWGSARYNPPIRAWDYDVDFNNAANLPPLSPRFVYQRQERFTRSYDRQASLPILPRVGSLMQRQFVGVLPLMTRSLWSF
ncbi:MAG TPA: hypothetical protein V6D19_22010 [Stenomitos sp.]